jgi:hypothetical protein
MANNTEQSNVAQFADDHLATLHSLEWPINTEARLREVQSAVYRLQRRRRVVFWAALSIVAAFVIVLAIPSTRVRAQVLFQRFALRGIQVVAVRPDLYSALLFEWTIRPIPAHLVTGPDAAAREAGFVANLPDWTMVSQPVPSFGIGVMGAGAGRYQIRVSDLRTALSRAGASDVVIPNQWEGNEIAIEMSPTIYVNARGFVLIQFLPGHILAPTGFDLARFAEALLRVGGLPPQQALTIAQKLGTNPGVLLGMPSDSQLDMHEVSLRSGTAVVIENRIGNEPPKACILCPRLREVVVAWQSRARTYILKTELTEARAIEIANSLP